MKKILTVQDLSCVGKCSLSVAMPILSVMGLETCVLPTAVLSNHTAFEQFSFLDLTKEMETIENAWEGQKIKFDGIYSGYLGSEEQIGHVMGLYDRFCAPGALRILDPVMADGGSLYHGFDMKFVDSMRGLCTRADAILPNLTEACLLTGRPFREDGDESYYRKIALALSGPAAGEPGPRYVVLTGYRDPKGGIGALGYDREADHFCTFVSDCLPVTFHGTGDIFASVFTGAMMRGKSLDQAVALAVEFDYKCIAASMKDQGRRWYGVNFEEVLPELAASLA